MSATVENTTMTDEMIANELLMTAKAALKCYAAAITEAPTYEVRVMLQKQLDDAIGAHEQIMNFMINKDWYHPYNIKQQFALDLKTAKDALN